MTQTGLPYNGTAGYVPVAASKERALREVRDGTLSWRMRTVLGVLELRGTSGATWREVATLLDMHHGQASGALSTLHRMGLVFSLRSKRDKCHPYVHAMHREAFAERQRHDTPSTTRAGAKRQLLLALQDECEAACRDGFTDDNITAIIGVLDSLRAHDQRDGAQGLLPR